MEQETRMKEIAGNLKRDVKDLLNESANIVAGFFKQGLCTVRGAATRWKNFTHGISESVGMLFQPVESALPPAPPLDSQPMVTVMESNDPELPIGTRLTLYEAEMRIEELNHNWDYDGPERAVTVAIDYIMEGEQDRYWLPLSTGPGCRPMLEQMEDYVTGCLSSPDDVTQGFYMAPEGLGALLHEHFGPQLQNDLEKLSTKVLHFFRQHSSISRMEQQFEVQTQAMPEKEREKFTRSMSETVVSLRRAANTGQVLPPAPEKMPEQTTDQQAEQSASSAQEKTPKKDGAQRPRRSVRIHIREIKAGQAPEPKHPKGRTNPQR